MMTRPKDLGFELKLASVEDVDRALHEMSLLTLDQRRIEDPSKALIQRTMTETLQTAVIDVAGCRMTIKERRDALSAAILQ